MTTKHPIVALWAVPRSVSTAFERMMARRGDFIVFNEPFSAAYYFGPGRVSDRYAPKPEQDCDEPEQVLARLREAAAEAPVFFKDMAYHVHRFLDWDWLGAFRNAVLVRDPRLALVSLHKKMPDFTREETGYESLVDLVEVIHDNTGAYPLVMDGEALRANPPGVCEAFCAAVDVPFVPEALEWESGEEQHWNHWNEWYTEAAASRGFEPPAARFDVERLKEPAIAAALEYCMPCYEWLSSRGASPSVTRAFNSGF